jgi:hypothetical protein
LIRRVETSNIRRDASFRLRLENLIAYSVGSVMILKIREPLTRFKK